MAWIKNFSRNYGLIISGWLLVEIMLFFHFGFGFKMEAEKYINEANYLVRHHSFSELRFLFYFSTTGIIILANFLGLGLKGAVFFNMLINLFSYLYFFKALCSTFYNKFSAYMVVFLLLTYVPYQSWSLFLYSECLFYSSVLILFSHLLLFKRLSFGYCLSTLFILIFLLLSRPLGILFLAPLLMFFYFHLSPKQKIVYYGISLAGIFCFYFAAKIIFTTISDWHIMKPFLEDDIICDWNDGFINKNILVSSSSNPFIQLFYYIVHNRRHFFSLAGLKLVYFFFLVRDYYSFLHNVYLLVYLVLIYGSILIGFKSIFTTISKSLLTFILLSLFLFSVSVVLQCDDYSNRFFLTLMPLFFFMVGVVIDNLAINRNIHK